MVLLVTGPIEAQTYHFVFKNNCSGENVTVAILYRGLDNVWVSQGWWAIQPGATIRPNVDSNNSVFYFVGLGSGSHQWDGQNQENSRVVQVTQQPFTNPLDQPPRSGNIFSASMRMMQADKPEYAVMLNCPDSSGAAIPVGGATLQETVNWIASKIRDGGGVYRSYNTYITSYSFRGISACSMTIIRTVVDEAPAFENLPTNRTDTTVVIPLDGLRVKESLDGIALSKATSSITMDEHRSFQANRQTERRERDTRSQVSEFFVSFKSEDVDNQDLIPRMAKAFRHAADLCQGTTSARAEPF